MNTRSKEKTEFVEEPTRQRGRRGNVNTSEKLAQSGIQLASSPGKINKKKIKLPNPKSEQLQHISKQIDESVTHDNNSKQCNAIILDDNSNCVIEDRLNASNTSLETKFVRPINKEISNIESPLKHQRFYLRSSIVEKIGKRTTYQSISPTKKELCSSDVGLNELFKKQKLHSQSDENNITEFHSAECTSDVEFYEMQHPDMMQRTDSPSSYSSDSASFSSRIPKFRDDFGLNITHHQSPCNRNGNIITSPTRGRLQRHSSGSSFSSEISNISSKNQSKSSPSICDKWLWHKNKQLSEMSCIQNDNQLKRMEKQSCMPLFLTETEYVPVPSEAETAPHNPRGELFLGGIVSKIQQKFAEEKSTVSCHWLAPDDFHVEAVSLLKQNIEGDIKCSDDICKDSNFSFKDHEKENELSPSLDGIEDIRNENKSLPKDKKKKKKRSQTALLHASLQEISWAKNLNPENMLTSERKPQERKLRDSTKKKTQDGALALKRKELINKLRKNKRIPKYVPKNTGKLNKILPNYAKTFGKDATSIGSTKMDKGYTKQSSVLSPQKTSPNLKSKQIVKKYIKKNEKSQKNKIVGKPKKSLKNEKVLSHEGKKPTANNVTKINRSKVCLTSKSDILPLKQLPSNYKYAKHKSDNSAGKLLSLKNSCGMEPKHKSGKSSDSSVDKVPELRVTLKPLEDINIWKIRKRNEEIKRKHCHYSSKSYKLTTTKGELKTQVFHKMKTTWNKITPQQKQQFYSNNVSNNLYTTFSGIKRSSTSFTTYRTSKRKKYDEETTRYSIRQSECAFRYKEIAIKKHHNFIQIILVPNRSRQNSLTIEGMKELREALFAACKDPGCRAVLFNSSGSIFCSGIDLNPVIGCTRKVVAEEIANSIRDLVQTMGSFPKPLVAAVNGMAVGFGVTLLTFCDVVLASDKATFFMPYAKLGYIAEGAATLTLPQVIGATMATDMLLRGRKLTAQEALRCGLVSEVLWPTQLMEEAVPRMQALAAQSLQVMEATKSMIRYHLWEKLQSTLEDECRSLPKQWISSVCQQAIRNAMENNILME